MDKEKFIQVCPKCKSGNISRDKTLLFEGAVGLPSLFICNNCGHSGYAFPEVAVSKLKKFNNAVEEKNLKTDKKDNSKLVDTSYGEFQVRFFWKITGPLFLLLGFFILFQDIIGGLLILAPALFMVYIAYFKKRKIKP